MDEATRAVMLDSLVRKWAEVARRRCGSTGGAGDKLLLRQTWQRHAELRQRCGWTETEPPVWTEDDTWRVRVELSRLRLELEGVWTSPLGEEEARMSRSASVAVRACSLTGVLLGWPDGTLRAPPPVELWNVIGESMEVLHRADVKCVREEAAPRGPSTHPESWEFSLGPGA